MLLGFIVLLLIDLTAQNIIGVPLANGPSADRPVLLFEKNGVFGQPWGAAGNSWPEQLFWNNVPANNNHHLQEMKDAANGIESSGRVPVLGCVAWGYEYTSATGGDTSNLAALPDMSNVGGWKQWGEWMQDLNHTKYYSTNWHGVAEPGYVTPLMPMEPFDWPAEWLAPQNWIAPQNWVNAKPVSEISYAQWLGIRLAQLALKTGTRGLYCADYVVGLEWGDAIDYNERVVNDFSKWAGVVVPQGSVAERSDFIQTNHKSLWFDFKCVRFAEFYCSMGQNLLDNGKVPFLGGQILGESRGSGNDFRIYTHGINGSMSLPGKHWFFNVELQSDDLRPPHNYWESSIRMGALACREPDMRLGAQLNAFGGQGMFNRSLKIAKKDTVWGKEHITNQWLSVGWTHIAGRDGVVRRAPMSFMRSYWDAGKTPSSELNLILNHIPRHPFGPAVYYSVAIERSFEKGNGKKSNSWYMCGEKYLRELSPIQNATRQGYLRGLFGGYWVSDVGIDHLKPIDYPAAWIVYDSEYLPDEERTKLEAIAPIIDPEKKFSEAANKIFPLCPVYIEQDSEQCLNGMSFVDQNNSVIIMVSNSQEKIASGKLVFQNLVDGTHNCNGLLACNDTVITVVDGTAQLPVNIHSRGNIVFEIPGMKWLKPGVVDINNSLDKVVKPYIIYPTTSTGDFFIQFSTIEKNAEVTVFNALGKSVFNKVVDGLIPCEIKLDNCKKGVYVVKINVNTWQFIEKVVIQ